jgi:hypothetical protein
MTRSAAPTSARSHDCDAGLVTWTVVIGYTRRMHWELWDIESGNLVGQRGSIGDALMLVREIRRLGWPMNALALFAEDESAPVDAVPLVVPGSELARRAAVAADDPRPQTAAMGPDVADEGFRLFYRIVKTNPPTLLDFRSGKAKGEEPPDDPRLLAVFDGISVFSKLSQARRKRRRSPVLGQYVAVLRVPTDGSVRFERTFRDEGHHTIWADEALLRSFVVSVIEL